MRLLTNGLRKRIVLGDVLADLVGVIVVVGQRRVHVRQAEARTPGENLIRREPQRIVPNHDVLHAHAVPGDMRTPASNAGRHLDVFTADSSRCHSSGSYPPNRQAARLGTVADVYATNPRGHSISPLQLSTRGSAAFLRINVRANSSLIA